MCVTGAPFAVYGSTSAASSVTRARPAAAVLVDLGGLLRGTPLADRVERDNQLRGPVLVQSIKL